MAVPYRVFLLGFSDFERSALGSTFRLAASRVPAYELTLEPDEAHFLVVDADHTDAVRVTEALDRVKDAVFVGAEVPEGATAWMMRPIDPLHVLRELDAMAALIAPPPALALAEHSSPPPRRAKPVPGRRASDAPGGARPGPAVHARALLVDDSEIALRYLETRLERLGVATMRATSSGKAIELLAQQDFGFVFIDVELGRQSDLDGLALCQHIKRHHLVGAGQPAPVVAMVSAHHSEVDRVRGALAGCDAYLGKPLDDGALLRMLATHGHSATPA